MDSTLAVVVYVRGMTAVVCSIECARRRGFEPARLPLPEERKDLEENGCVFCNIDNREED